MGLIHGHGVCLHLPTSEPAVYNPFLRGVPVNPFTSSHTARVWTESVTAWGPSLCNMWKLWYDRWDGWPSLLDNAHQQVGMQWFQSANACVLPPRVLRVA